MYDHIVVGAGTAGSVLTERLTSDGRNRVLLLEAGSRPTSPFVKIPAGFPKLFGSKFDWCYTSRHREADRNINVPRGKMLGGSSNMNAQIHQWCHPADFDEWAERGASGWSWRDVRNVFASQEALSGADVQGRGRDGPMRVAPVLDPHPLSRAFVAAASGIVRSTGPSYNGAAYEGAWISEIAHWHGRRYSAYDAYLKPCVRRQNLHVVQGVEVSRIIIQGDRAGAVEVRRGTQTTRYECTQGVVLAAGAIGSPLVLMRSGIGPAADLSRHGIPMEVHSAEVGRNLQDHPLVPVVIETLGRDTFKNAETIANLLRYILVRNGMLASNAVEAIAFTASSKARSAAPDVELIFAPLEWRDQGTSPPAVHAVTIGAVVAKPLSRGRVSLPARGLATDPCIDFNLLGDQEGSDLAVMLEAVQLARRVAAQPPLDAYLKTNASDTRPDSVDWLHQRIQTVYHPCGTCRMGDDPASVVDSSLRVRGVRGLWVADASIFPCIPRGHPNAVVAMVAERGAKFITNSDFESWPDAPPVGYGAKRGAHVVQAL